MSNTDGEDRAAKVADQLVGHVLAKQPRLGSTRLVCVDGRAGAGKTTLGQALHTVAVPAGTTRLLHMDDIYKGWSGLDDVSGSVERDLIGPLREDRQGGYRRYDWHLGRFAEWCTVDPVDVLILEGVGSGSQCYSSCITTLVWVQAPRAVRLQRGVERDGQAVLPRWLAWMQDEDRLFEREHTEARADVVVDGTGLTQPVHRA